MQENGANDHIPLPHHLPDRRPDPTNAPRPTPRVGTATVRIPRISTPEARQARVTTILDMVAADQRRRGPIDIREVRLQPVIPAGYPSIPRMGLPGPTRRTFSTARYNPIARPDPPTAIDAEETFWRDIFSFDILNWEHRNIGYDLDLQNTL